MDEATSSVDGETDAAIQHMLRHLPALAATTILSVAHRIHTIIDYDAVCVLDAGSRAGVFFFERGGRPRSP